MWRRPGSHRVASPTAYLGAALTRTPILLTLSWTRNIRIGVYLGMRVHVTPQFLVVLRFFVPSDGQIQCDCKPKAKLHLRCWSAGPDWRPFGYEIISGIHVLDLFFQQWQLLWCYLFYLSIYDCLEVFVSVVEIPANSWNLKSFKAWKTTRSWG